MFIPGFYPESKSDEELMNQLSDLHQKVTFMSRYSGGSDAVAQMQMMIQTINLVLQDRAQQKLFTARMKVQKDVVESDPDMADSGGKNKAGVRNPATKRKSSPQRIAVMRSSKPVNQMQIDPPKDT